MPENRLTLTALEGLPEFEPGDDLAGTIVAAAVGVDWRDGLVLAVAQKIVSKAEGRRVDLSTVNPSAFARRVAETLGKDSQLVEVILQESRRIVRMDRGVLIAETHHGFICANAGVDLSNAGRPGHAVLLPKSPDLSAQQLREKLRLLTGADCGVIITDSFGRPWRMGQAGVALGAAGVAALDPHTGRTDRDGRPLEATTIAVADEIAAAAGLLMHKAAGYPVVLVEGMAARSGESSGRELLRPPSEDLFR